MSKEAVIGMLTEANEDPALRARIEAIGTGEIGVEETAAFVSDAAERGFEFTAEEFNEVVEMIRRHDGDEISDEDLEQVAGGWGFSSLGQSFVTSGVSYNWARTVGVLLVPFRRARGVS